MAKDFNCQVSCSIRIAPFPRVQTKAPQSFQRPVPKLMCIFSIFVEISQTGNDKPFVYGGASVGDVIIAKDQSEANGSSKQEILDTCEERACISC